MPVVDASVIVSALLPHEPYFESSKGFLRHCVDRDELILIPALALAEVAGPIARRTNNTALGQRSVAFLLGLPTLRIVSIDDTLGTLAAKIAAEQRLKGADAVYVAIAKQLQLTLVSWDQEQITRSTQDVSVQTPSTYS